MPEAYCHCCGKVTAHKVVMERSRNRQISGWQTLQQLVSLILKGEHYYQLEQQYYCRVCNHRSETNFSMKPGEDQSDYHDVNSDVRII